MNKVLKKLDGIVDLDMLSTNCVSMHGKCSMLNSSSDKKCQFFFDIFS